MIVSARSVVFDIADNWGYENVMAVRAIDFILSSVSLGMLPADYTAYATTNDIYAVHAFDTSLSVDGNQTVGIYWPSDGGSDNSTNQRLIIVFDSVQNFEEIRAVNSHVYSSFTDMGVRNVKITISDDVITSTVYNEAVPNSTVLNDTEWLEHPSSSTGNWQTVYVDNSIELTIGGNLGLSGSVDFESLMVIEGGIGLSGSINVTDEIIGIQGNLGLSGEVNTLENKFKLSGFIGLSGHCNVCVPNFFVMGQLGLSGSIDVSNGVPVMCRGTLGLSGVVDALRINKDVSFYGVIGLVGCVGVSIDHICELSSYDSSRWS